MMIHNLKMMLLIYKIPFKKRKKKNLHRTMSSQMPIKDLLNSYLFSVNLMILTSFGDIS